MCTDETNPVLDGPAWFHDQRDERRILAWAFSAALAVHVLFVFVQLPAAQPPPSRPEPVHRPITLVDLPLQPPRISQPAIERTPSPRRELLPVPFPQDVLVPVGGGDIDQITIPASQMPILFGDNSAPPAPPGPRTPDGQIVSFPRLIPDSKVSPDYPELARAARLPGRVILQAVIREDGTVDEVSVLQCTRPGVGFEQAAIEAIRRWRYEPGVQNGLPVDVYFTIVVEFALH